MTEKHKNFFAAMLMLGFLFAGSAGMSYLLMEVNANSYNLSAEQLAAVQAAPEKPRTFLWKEQYALCAMYDLGCKAEQMAVDESVEAQIRELSLNELAELYPLPEWTIEAHDNEVIILHNLEGLCRMHHNIYHLGCSANGQYVAVYYGPGSVGSSAGAFLVTDVPLNRLSVEQQAALHAGSYEYYSQDDLIAMLDNFSEL